MGGDALSTTYAGAWEKVKIDEIDAKIYKRVSLGAGPKDHNHPSYLRVDKNPAVEPDILWDLSVYPWPFEDSSVHEIWCEHFAEHVADQVSFWNEVYRICADKALVHVYVPHRNHDDAWSDPTHKFFFTRRFFHYLSVPGRLLLGIESYEQDGFKMDLEMAGYCDEIDEAWQGHSLEAQRWAIQHHANVVKQIHCDLLAYKPMRTREQVAAK